MRNLSEKKLPILRKRKANLEPVSARLRQAEEELRCFFTNTLGMLCIAGFDGYFKRLNPAWTTTLGWTLEELQGRPFLEFVHPDDRAATRSAVNQLACGGRTIAFEHRCRCKDGSYKWLLWNAKSLRARQQIYAITRDVTLRKGLEKEITETRDQEKRRLGRELHDGLCQNLAGIAALSATMSRKLAAGSNPPAADAAEITRLLNETIGHVHNLARGLNPVSLERLGLVAALQALAANVQALFRVACLFQCNRPLLKLDPTVETHLYRIAQEAVNNAITHGRGNRIEISLRFRKQQGSLSIRDDGVGISQKTLTREGLGLHTMDYRSRLIGGSLQVQRRARRGTAVICRFPLLFDPPKERHHARKKT